MYADDTTINTRNREVVKAIQNLREKVNKLLKWYEDNRLEVNERKTVLNVYISGTSTQKAYAQNVSITINGNEIKTTEKVKYLGIIVDEQIRWDDQVNETIKKLRNLMPVMRRISGSLNEENKKEIYHTIIESRLTFAINIWGNTSKTRMKKLQRTQNKIIRVLYNKKRTENIDCIYEELNIGNCYDMYLHRKTEYAWNILKGTKKSNIKTEFRETQDDAVQTRGNRRRTLVERRKQTNWGRRSTENITIKILNHLERKGGLLTNLSSTYSYPRKEVKNLWKSLSKEEKISKFWE